MAAFWEDEIYHMYDDLYLKIVKLRHIEKRHKKIVSYWFNDDSDERGILINYHNIKILSTMVNANIPVH